ncbi:MAG: RtcB family protein [Nitrososphaerales archaeon]
MASPPLKRISDVVWEIPQSYKEGMRVPARIYATDALMRSMDRGVFEQITNVACLPGIQKYAYVMPDAHWGYGFPIGGVAAFSLKEGVISPGGIGFDINCGVRLIRTDLTLKDVKPKLKELIDTIFQIVPAGVGARGLVRVTHSECKEVLERGAEWSVEKGIGWKEDLERTEDNGKIKGADPSKVSSMAIQRGFDQVGTLGSGNHYLEVQVVDPNRYFDRELAKHFGITMDDQILVMIHCGSRGFGHQIGTDYLRIFERAMKKYGITVRDRELACAPFESPEGQDYYKAMACAANMAFANRQVITHRIREAFSKVFHADPEKLGIHLVYDVAHNIAKIERHKVNGEVMDVIVHRKGATRSFGPGENEVPQVYRHIGQPVIIGGSMETGSYLLVGTTKAMTETFGSTAHGSGRTMSREAAKKRVSGHELQRDLERRGIYVRAVSMSGLAEEAGLAYKDISEVVEATYIAGISKKVVALRPLGNIKG